MESLSYESSWESEKFVACPGYCSWELQCQGLNFGGGKATSVGFLGCVRSKLFVLFGEGVHLYLQPDIALTELEGSVIQSLFFSPLCA